MKAAETRLLPALGSRPLLRTIFTIPADMRERAWDRRWWGGRVLALRRHLKKWWGLEGALVSYHPAGDKEPDVFKPHIEVLWWRPPGLSGRFPVEAFAVLRWAWARILGVSGPVDLKHSYIRLLDRRRIPKIRHRIRYAVRPFPGWARWRGRSVRWWGRFPKPDGFCRSCCEPLPVESKDWTRCPWCGELLAATCLDCGEAVRYLGPCRGPP